MFAEILIAIALGILAGCITGLTPGVHVNLVAVVLVGASPLLLDWVHPLVVGCVIVACAVTHSLVDPIPSVYLGAPDSDMALTVLPGHRMLLEGRGHDAIVYTVVGSLGALVVCAALFLPFSILMRWLQPVIEDHVGWGLLVLVLFMIVREHDKLGTLRVYVLSGTLGYVLLQSYLTQPLFHLLSGLFGVSTLVYSLQESSVFPAQKKEEGVLGMGWWDVVKGSSVASVLGFFAGFLPGFSASQAGIVGAQFLRNASTELFLVLVGGINTASFVISLVTVAALEKARNGAIISVGQLLSFSTEVSLFFVGVCLFAGGFASIATMSLSKGFSRVIQKVHYPSIVVGVIGFIMVLSFVFDGFVGVLCLVVSTLLGLYTQYAGVGKHHLMGCLLLPVMGYFLF